MTERHARTATTGAALVAVALAVTSLVALPARAAEEPAPTATDAPLAPAVRLAPGCVAGPPEAPCAAPPPAGLAGCLERPVEADGDGLYDLRASSHVRQVAAADTGGRGPIVVIGDSLTVQSARRTALALRDAGWGPVCIEGVVAATVQFGNTDVPDGVDMVDRIRRSHPMWASPDVKVVVALGTNDVGFTGGRYRSYVDTMLAAIGPTSQPVAWVDVRTARGGPWPSREAAFDRAVAESGVQVLDWAAGFRRAYCGRDLVHLVEAGISARVALLGAL